MTNAVLSKATFGSIFVSLDGVLCAKEIHRLGPMDFKIYILAKNPRLWLDSYKIYRFSSKLLYLCDFHLRAQRWERDESRKAHNCREIVKQRTFSKGGATDISFGFYKHNIFYALEVLLHNGGSLNAYTPKHIFSS